MRKDETAAPSSLAEEMFRELEGMLVDGRLAIGEHINESVLAERLGVSRGPIREACRRLEQAGLVEFKVNRGFFVKEIALADALEIYEVRAALFFHAGRVLARRISGAQIAELEDLNRQMLAAFSSGGHALFYTLNRTFHSRIMQYTGNKRLAAVYEAMDRELHLWRKRALALDADVSSSSDDHAHIIEVLRGGNPAAIARALRDHSLSGRNRLLRTMPDQVRELRRSFEHEEDEI